MATSLCTCVECGAPLSPDAVRCPRCTADHPHGLFCCVCRQMVRASIAVALLNNSTNFEVIKHSERASDSRGPYMGNPGSIGGWYHHECLQKALGIPLPQAVECGHCHNNVPYSITCQHGYDGHYLYSRVNISACPTCGNPNLLSTFSKHHGLHHDDNCSACELPIILGLHSAYLEVESNP